MSARLIINADDFGLTSGINRAVEDLHRAGVLSSATLMANGPAFEDAVALARRNPSLGIGCHIVLVDGVPLSPPDRIPSLLGPDRRRLRPSLLNFAAAATTGKLREQELRTEALAQIRRIQAAGLHVTHLDTHKHTHTFPSVAASLVQVAREASVPLFRNPFEPQWSLALGAGSLLRRLQIQALALLGRRFHATLRAGSIATTGGTMGIAATGHLDKRVLTHLLHHLPPGTWELVCHPGYNDADLDRVPTRLRTHRDIERLALLDVVPKTLSEPDPPLLIHYGEISLNRAPGPRSSPV